MIRNIFASHSIPVTAEQEPQGQQRPKIMKPPQSLPLQMAEHLLRHQPDSVANHVTARLISINVSNA